MSNTPVLIIVNAYDPEFVHRVEIPNRPDNMCASFITSTNDLFFVCRSRKADNKNFYFVYYIDLDEGNRRENPKCNNDNYYDAYNVQHLFEYSAESVDEKELLSIFARGSSAKEKIDIGEQLIIFMLHQGKLYSWQK